MSDKKETTMETEVYELNALLKESLQIYRDNRDMAKKNYETLKKQHSVIIMAAEMSEEGALERELNIAMKVVVDSGKHLDNVIQTISKLLTTQLNNDAKLRIADKVIDGSQKLTAPININRLLDK